MIADQTTLRIKAATRDLIAACGGLERAAEIASVSTSQLSRCQKPNHGDVIGLMQVLALEAECQLPMVTTVMAEAHGRRLSDPDGDGAKAAHVFQRLADVSVAAAEAMAASAMAQADGVITPAEAEMVDRQLGELERRVGVARQAAAGAKLKVVGGGA